MTQEKAARAQARAERLADLVEDTALRSEILALAAEMRRSTWRAAAGVSPEPRAFRSDRDEAGGAEASGPSVQAPAPRTT